MALVTLVAGGALAACGSASSSNTTTSSTTASASASGSGSSSGAAGGGANSARRTQLVSCLKAHGVTLPSRPAGAGAPPGGAPGGSGSGTGTGTTGTGTTPRRGFFFGGGGGRNISPKMQAAFKACGAKFGFRGGAGGGFGGRISHTAITNFVTCVKQHGYNLPAPNFSGKGPIFPRNIETNAKFQAAAKSCQHLLIPPRPCGGSGTGTSTTSGA